MEQRGTLNGLLTMCLSEIFLFTKNSNYFEELIFEKKIIFAILRTVSNLKSIIMAKILQSVFTKGKSFVFIPQILLYLGKNQCKMFKKMLIIEFSFTFWVCDGHSCSVI